MSMHRVTILKDRLIQSILVILEKPLGTGPAAETTWGAVALYMLVQEGMLTWRGSALDA
jgi:hypothetical protein